MLLKPTYLSTSDSSDSSQNWDISDSSDSSDCSDSSDGIGSSDSVVAVTKKTFKKILSQKKLPKKIVVKHIFS